MILSCIKCLIFTKNKDIKAKHEIDGKIIIYSCSNDYSFKKLVTIDKEEITDLLKKIYSN